MVLVTDPGAASRCAHGADGMTCLHACERRLVPFGDRGERRQLRLHSSIPRGSSLASVYVYVSQCLRQPPGSQQRRVSFHPIKLPSRRHRQLKQTTADSIAGSARGSVCPDEKKKKKRCNGGASEMAAVTQRMIFRSPLRPSHTKQTCRGVKETSGGSGTARFHESW